MVVVGPPGVLSCSAGLRQQAVETAPLGALRRSLVDLEPDNDHPPPHLQTVHNCSDQTINREKGKSAKGNRMNNHLSSGFWFGCLSMTPVPLCCR